MDRLEAPLDYRQLWTRLYNELDAMKVDIAKRAATENSTTQDDLCIRVARHQGAYRFVDRLQAKMDEIVQSARDTSNGKFAVEDDA